MLEQKKAAGAQIHTKEITQITRRYVKRIKHEKNNFKYTAKIKSENIFDTHHTL